MNEQETIPLCRRPARSRRRSAQHAIPISGIFLFFLTIFLAFSSSPSALSNERDPPSRLRAVPFPFYGQAFSACPTFGHSGLTWVFVASRSRKATYVYIPPLHLPPRRRTPMPFRRRPRTPILSLPSPPSRTPHAHGPVPRARPALPALLAAS